MRAETENALLRERLTRSIAENLRDCAEADVLCRMRELGMPAPGAFWAVCEISLHAESLPPERQDRVMARTEQIFCRGLRNTVTVYPYGSASGNVALILSAARPVALARAEEMLEALLGEAEAETAAAGIVAVGRTVTSVLDVRLSAADALTCLAHKHTVGIGRIIHIRDVNRMTDRLADEDSNVATERILGCFLDGNVPKLKKRLNERLQMIVFDPENDYFTVRQTYIELMSRILRQTAELGVLLADNEASDGIRFILQAEDPSAIEVWFINCCIRYISLIGNRKTERITLLIRGAEEYVAQNYADCTLSQQSVGEYLHLTGAYFGQLFFNKTGQKFVDYLKEYRVTVSKDLLRAGNGRIKDISKAVGFSNAGYYNTVFKKIAGMTPQEYRCQNR